MSKSINISRKSSLSLSGLGLPASKSVSNRAIVLNALGGNSSKLNNLSDARDTRLMLSLINSKSLEIDPQDAGTTMRFLSAYFAVSGQEKIMIGSARMQQRPIGILIDALRSIGAEIDYLKNEGYPPLHIRAFHQQQASHLKIRSDVSSQFISALMMISPALPQGLSIELEGKTGSKPYIDMTAALMRRFGAEVKIEERIIKIGNKPYQGPENFTIESDWSAASYWYAFAALADHAELTLSRLNFNSIQGDRVIADIMVDLGVESQEVEGGINLIKKDAVKDFNYDFSDCPDLAQTVAVVCAAKNIKATFRGLESLKIKETDRCQALKNELAKIGAEFTAISEGVWQLDPPEKITKEKIVVSTYEDHRMAMAFAPLACLMDVEMEDPEVVNKSYPEFWNEMKRVGFNIS